MITTNPDKMGGQPCIGDTRITVASVLALYARDFTDDQILALYPGQIDAQDLADLAAWWASPAGIGWAIADLVRERDEARALAEEQRVRLLFRSPFNVPAGWSRFENAYQFGLRWQPELLCFVRVCVGIQDENEYHSVEVRTPATGSYRAWSYSTAVAAWNRAQTLRAHIEQHGTLPKENP